MEDRIKAFFGSREKWEPIPNWDEYQYCRLGNIPKTLEHGYDENKEKTSWIYWIWNPWPNLEEVNAYLKP